MRVSSGLWVDDHSLSSTTFFSETNSYGLIFFPSWGRRLHQNPRDPRLLGPLLRHLSQKPKQTSISPLFDKVVLFRVSEFHNEPFVIVEPTCMGVMGVQHTGQAQMVRACLSVMPRQP